MHPEMSQNLEIVFNYARKDYETNPTQQNDQPTNDSQTNQSDDNLHSTDTPTNEDILQHPSNYSSTKVETATSKFQSFYKIQSISYLQAFLRQIHPSLGTSKIRQH